MKKFKKFISIILFFSLLMMLPSIYYGYYKGHDTNFHLANISSITDMLSFKNPFAQEPLKFIGNNFGYGTRFFYPPLPHLLASYISKILLLFNGNVTVGMRITQWITIFLSGISMFLLTFKIYKKPKVATICSIVYMTMPYHLSEIFIRDAFSEMFIPAFIPLILLGLLYLIENEYKKFLLFFVLGYTLIIYSHIAMSIYFTIIIIFSFFIIYFKKIFTKEKIKYLLIASILILLLTASFWLPLLEIKLKGDYGVFIPYFMTRKGDLRFSTINILELINFSHTYNFDSIRFNLPIYVVILLLISLIFILKDKLFKNKINQFLIIFTIISCIMITKLFPWYYIPNFLHTLQFPWRLVIYICFSISILIGISLNKICDKKYIFILLIIVSLFGSYYYNNHLNSEKVDLSNIDYNNMALGNQKEYLPYDSLNNLHYFENRDNSIKILTGTGIVETISNNVPDLTFKISNSSNLSIELPRIYYLGYKLKKDNKNINLEKDNYGFIKISNVEDGIYTLSYKGTNIMKLSNILSLFTFIGIIVYILKKKYFSVP